MSAANTDPVNDSIQFAIRDGVAAITLNKPEKLNAMSVAMDRLLNELVIDINNNDDIKAVVLTGAGGRAFCAGSDLTDLEGYGTSWQYRNRFDRNLDYAIGIWKIRKPVITAVDGYCIGGGLEMFCASDVRLATRASSFGASEIKWGWHGGSGATQFLTRVVGPGHASELLLTGERIDAAEADRIGLLNHLYETREDMMRGAMRIAQTIASRPPIAVEAVKKLVRVAQSSSIDIGLAYENDLFTYEMRTNDADEGKRAFAEKRAAEFRGD
ncbi:enoyl-CoA hydratase [Mycobacterium frederiksbergense]|uniref:Enoyl-CoA hydratase n=1 Tax=Mycolicibacterium frederiksbergense TaxID=117567 RepID=A0ABT6L4F6_9MYCO|nr:enoyl-CoA hydratase/isomerase family protein [Mycolicibacterium frederiksbergense]MDH6197828.1 enoyl-CoA hydratase [Mycolicibacterium frederiksbergense]